MSENDHDDAREKCRVCAEHVRRKYATETTAERVDELFTLYTSALARIDDLETETGVLNSRLDEVARAARRAR